MIRYSGRQYQLGLNITETFIKSAFSKKITLKNIFFEKGHFDKFILKYTVLPNENKSLFDLANKNRDIRYLSTVCHTFACDLSFFLR